MEASSLGEGACKQANLIGGGVCYVGKEVSVVMEYNRQVPFGGAMAAEAAKAKNQTVEMRDMGFATVTIAEKDSSGQQRSNNVCQSQDAPPLACWLQPPAVLHECRHTLLPIDWKDGSR